MKDEPFDTLLRSIGISAPRSFPKKECNYIPGLGFVFSETHPQNRKSLAAMELARYVAKNESAKTNLQSMPYREYLQTEEWQKIRSAVLKRALYCCQLCSSKRKLNVHHRTYARRGNELSSDLIVLCEECHHVFHERRTLANNGRAD